MGFALLCVVVAVVVVSDPRRKSLSLPNFNGASGLTSTIGKQIDSRLTRSLATVGGELEVSLMWDTLSDLDLQVKDPTGDKVEAEHPRSNSGGEQDVDANPTPLSLDGTIKVMRGIPPGVEALEPIPEYRIDARESQDVFGGMGLGGLTGQAPGKYTRTPIEHIFYAKAPRGEYIVYARCYSWREPNSNPLPFVIQVRSNGRVLKEVKATIGPSNYVADGVQPTEICRVTLP